MAYSFVQYPGNGSNTLFNVPFGYIAKSHVAVKVNGVATTFTWNTDTVVSVSPAPANGTTVEVRRTTPKTTAVVNFQDAGTVTEAMLDENTEQMLYIVQEAFDEADQSIQLASDNTWDAASKRIKDLATPTAAGDAVTKAYADDIINQAQTHATNAANSAAAAQGSANAAATTYDNFDDRYLGQKAAAPTLDNDGNALLIGALYFDTALNKMRVWDGAAWLDIAQPASAFAMTLLDDVDEKAARSTLRAPKIVNVLDAAYGVPASQTVDALAGLQNAANALVEGDTLYFPAREYLIAGYNQYVQITANNIRIEFAPGAEIVTENSSNQEATTDPHFCGLRIDSTDCEVINPRFRGGLIAWNGLRMTVYGGRFRNLHNAAIIPGSAIAFDRLTLFDTEFDVSLAADAGNYACIQRAATAVASTVELYGCKFRGVWGGVNVHSLKRLRVRNCDFIGVHGFAVKASTDDGGATGPDIDIDVDTCYFDGARISTTSANRHLSALDNRYGLFIDRYHTLKVQNSRFENFSVNTIVKLPLGFLNVTTAVENTVFKNNTVTCLQDLAGEARVVGCVFDTNTFALKLNSQNGVRAMTEVVERCLFVDSKVSIGATAFAAGQNKISLLRNDFNYSADNTGAVEFVVVSGASNFPLVDVEANHFAIGGGFTVAVKDNVGNNYLRCFNNTLAGSAVYSGVNNWQTFAPTVTLVGGAGNVVPQYSTNTGRYWRNGNVCTVNVRLTGDGGNEGAGTGEINVALPFPARNTTLNMLAGVASNGGNSYMLLGVLTADGTTLRLSYMNTISTAAVFTGDLQNNISRLIDLSFSYEVKD